MARPRRYDDAVRARLLEAASQALAKNGPSGVSLRSVATSASTTTAAVYTLFGSREALLDAVVTEGFRRFGEHLEAVPRTDDPSADLFALGLAYRTSALAEPHFYRAMFDIPAGPARDALAEPTFQRLQAAVTRLAGAAGEPDGDAATITDIAIGLWGMVHGMVSLELAGQLPGDLQARADRYAQTLQRAADAPPPALRPARPPG